MIAVEKNINKIDAATRSLISKRYKTITKAVNMEFWKSTSEMAQKKWGRFFDLKVQSVALQF